MGKVLCVGKDGVHETSVEQAEHAGYQFTGFNHRAMPVHSLHGIWNFELQNVLKASSFGDNFEPKFQVEFRGKLPAKKWGIAIAPGKPHNGYVWPMHGCDHHVGQVVIEGHTLRYVLETAGFLVYVNVDDVEDSSNAIINELCEIIAKQQGM